MEKGCCPRNGGRSRDSLSIDESIQKMEASEQNRRSKSFETKKTLG